MTYLGDFCHNIPLMRDQPDPRIHYLALASLSCDLGRAPRLHPVYPRRVERHGNSCEGSAFLGLTFEIKKLVRP